jgi:putative DNA primase/helicase
MASPKEKPRSFPLTDSGNAELIASLFGDRVRFDHRRDKWLIWKNNYWAEDCDGEVFRMAKQAARARLRDAADLSNDAKRREAVTWARLSESSYRLKAALDLARYTEPITDPGDKWDSEPFLLNVGNGVVDLRSGCLRPGVPADRISRHTMVVYDPLAGCPRFEEFLNQVFLRDDIIRFIQKAIGYCLTGDVREQCLFLCYGEGGNGKSTLLETVRNLLGDYAHNLPFSAFELKARSGASNDIAGIVSKRFVTSAETSQNVAFNEARVKALTGGDRCTARFLYGEFFTFAPTAKFWLAFNHKPRVADNSYGFWRRVRLIEFPLKFEGISDDKELAAKLNAESSGILAWAVRGCLLWQQEGLEQPLSLRQATKAYRQESDTIGKFLDDCYQIDPSGFVTSGGLREVYLRWCADSGEKPLDARSLAEGLRGHNLTSGQMGHARTRGWKGLTKRSDAPSRRIGNANASTDADARVQ